MALYLGPNLISGVFTSYHTTTYDTSDANATSADILMGKKAYVNGSLVTGNIPSRTGNDVTTSGATFTIPAGHYASAYTGNINNGALRTPSYSTNNSTAEVTVTYGVSTAGYLATSAPTWTFRPFGNPRTSVVQTYGQTITPSTTGQKSITIPAGYYPNAETVYIAQAAAGGAAQTGTISASSKVYTISTTFTPKGFMMVASNYYFDGDLNLMSLWAFSSSTTASGYYESSTSGSSGSGTYTVVTSDLFGSAFYDPPDSTASDYEPAELTLPGDFTSDMYASVLDPYLVNPASYYVEGSNAWLGDLGWSDYAVYSSGGGSSGSTDAYAVSGCTVSYSSTGITVTVNSSYYCPKMNYVVWG